MVTLISKLNKLSVSQLIQLSEELRLPTLADDALIREVIKDTEVDSTQPLLAFMAVGANLAFVLADRMIANQNHLKFIYNRMKYIHNENEDIDYMLKLKEIIGE